VRAFRHATVACLALALSLALGACGKVGKPSYDATAENNGTYVQLGTIYYQLQVSRELNPYATEDHEYLVGLPAGIKSPTPSQIWYGVFLRAINMGKHPEPAADNFKITDTQGDVYTPISLNPSVNPFVWTGQSLPPRGTEPAPNTMASFGPTQGGLLLFKLNTTVYNNRPLSLQVRAPGVSHVATISLDL
jgi:hypothetical protein